VRFPSKSSPSRFLITVKIRPPVPMTPIQISAACCCEVSEFVKSSITAEIRVKRFLTAPCIQ
jgi:hypothetical protein